MKAYLALGSNLGNRHENIRTAVALLNAHPDVAVQATSSLYETAPFQMAEEAEEAAWFINAAITIETRLEPQALLEVCLDIERRLGRERLPEWSAESGYRSRTLDMDILFYGDEIVDTPELTIPHPRLHERAFMLVPMLALAPDFQHPILSKTMKQLHLELSEPAEVVLRDNLQPA